MITSLQLTNRHNRNGNNSKVMLLKNAVNEWELFFSEKLVQIVKVQDTLDNTKSFLDRLFFENAAESSEKKKKKRQGKFDEIRETPCTMCVQYRGGIPSFEI